MHLLRPCYVYLSDQCVLLFPLASDRSSHAVLSSLCWGPMLQILTSFKYTSEEAFQRSWNCQKQNKCFLVSVSVCWSCLSPFCVLFVPTVVTVFISFLSLALCLFLWDSVCLCLHCSVYSKIVLPAWRLRLQLQPFDGCWSRIVHFEDLCSKESFFSTRERHELLCECRKCFVWRALWELLLDQLSIGDALMDLFCDQF